MAEFINEKDSLNEGRKKLNKAIEHANDAKSISEQADNKATQALSNSESTQEQLNQVVIDGDSSVEAAQARVDEKGQSHTTLKERIDDGFIKVNSQLAETEKEIFNTSLINRKKNKKTVYWIDDDGMKGVYTKIAPILREYDIKATSAIITNRPHGLPYGSLPAYDPSSDYMSYDQMQELFEEGLIEYISHTHTHRYFDTLSYEDIEWELSRSQEIIRSLGWNYKDFVYPGGRYDQKAIEIVKQYYESAYRVGGLPFEGTFSQYEIPRVGLSYHGFDVNEVIPEIDEAIDKHGFVVLMTHVDLGVGLDVVKMKAIVEHLLSRGVEFGTASDFKLNHGNLLETDDTIISSTGRIGGGTIGVYRDRNNAVNHLFSIENFERGTVTRSKVTQDKSADYQVLTDIDGRNTYGYIETYRDISHDVYSFQLFLDKRNRRTTVRYWEDDNWGEWMPFGGVYYDGGTPVTNNPNISRFVKGSTTKITVNSTDVGKYEIPTTGYNQIYGFIETYRDRENDAFSGQVFYDIKNNRIMMRKWDHNNNEWMPWKNTSHVHVLETNAVTASTSINSYQVGITIVDFDSDGDRSGLPGTGYGQMQVYKISDNIKGFNYREFKLNDSDHKFISTVHTDGSWGAWRKYVTEPV